MAPSHDPGPSSSNRSCRPDARFTLRDAGQLRYFFLEMDRSTEDHRRLLQKYLGYWWYLQSLNFRKANPGSLRVNVLFVTTGHHRMLNMMDTLRRMPKPNRSNHGGKGLFRFGLATDYSLDEPALVMRSIWEKATDPAIARRLSLLD